jgi:SAM-dependent methyltransferase
MGQFFVNQRLLPLASDERTLIVHPHCARTAGRAFRAEVLNEAVGPEHVYCRQHVIDWKSWADLTDADLEGYKAYTDLRDFSVIRLKRPHVGIAVVRHPMYRIVSLVGFIKRNIEHRHYEQANKYPMEEFYRIASEEHPSYFRNVQATRICGHPDGKLALDFIRSKYIAVGLTNQLTDFVHLLGGIFKWKPIEVKRVPSDEERYGDRISPSFREMVLRDNAEDMMVYEAVSQGHVMEAPHAALWKRAGYLTGYLPALGKKQQELARWFKGRRGKKRVSQAKKKQLRQERKAHERMDRAREMEEAADPGMVVCNLCGLAQPETDIKRVCPRCKSTERQRSFPAFYNAILQPIFEQGGMEDALLLSPGGIERKLVEPRFETVTISSLYNNNYRGHFVQADVRDLAPLDSESFDYVQACNVLEYIPEMDRALASILRVLRPGGMFCLHIINSRFLAGDAPISVAYETNPRAHYFPRGMAVPVVRLGLGTLKSMLTSTGFSFRSFDFPDPITKTVCTWWLCKKDMDAPVRGKEAQDTASV